MVMCSNWCFSLPLYLQGMLMVRCHFSPNTIGQARISSTLSTTSGMRWSIINPTSLRLDHTRRRAQKSHNNIRSDWYVQTHTSSCEAPHKHCGMSRQAVLSSTVCRPQCCVYLCMCGWETNLHCVYKWGHLYQAGTSILLMVAVVFQRKTC